MTSFSRFWYLAALVAGVILTAGFLTVCTDRSPQPVSPDKSQAREDELQGQLQLEQARRLEAEKSVRAAELSRNTWIICMGAGACLMSFVALLVGIHIGSRARVRSGKEVGDG